MKTEIILKSCRTIKHIHVGQELILVGTGNYSKYPIKTGVVEKIGNKYFYVKTGNYSSEKFDNETGECVNDYNYGYLLFETEEEYKKYKIAGSQYQDIYMYFHDNSFYRSKLSFETISKISKLIYDDCVGDS